MNADKVRQDAEEGFDATVDQIESARQKALNAFEQGKEQWMQIQDQAVQYSREAADSTDKFVRQKPWQAVGIAAAIGLVAGLLIRRR
jgi:ElaB protein